MTDDFDGQELIDSAGESTGTIQRTYVDDAGKARLVEVKIGHLLSRHRLVPADQAIESDGGLQVPYLRDVIEESPALDTGDTLTGDALQTVRDYYASDQSGGTEPEGAADGRESDGGARPVTLTAGEADITDSAASQAPNEPARGTEVRTEQPGVAGFGEVRDLGDVVEVPIVEEVLVKKPVVREVLRISKSHTTETGTAAADLRRERVEVLPSSGDLLTEDDSEE